MCAWSVFTPSTNAALLMASANRSAHQPTSGRSTSSEVKRWLQNGVRGHATLNDPGEIDARNLGDRVLVSSATAHHSQVNQ